MRGARHFGVVEHQEHMRRRVTALWAEGFTMSEIARRLGVTKNVVSGMRWRMGLPNRPSPVRQDPRKHTRRSPVVHTLPALDPPPVDEPPLPAADFLAAVRKPKPPRKPRPPRLEVTVGHQDCQWALNDGPRRHWLFCEAPKAEGSVYCAEHHALAYTGRDRRGGPEPVYA
jgi:GcrA cell cycle regulator